MKFQGRILWLVLATACAITAYGNVIMVPELRHSIQEAISIAGTGDVISVWGPVGVPPPYTYNENVDYLGKSLLVVNRSFLPDGGTGYDSSCEHVVIHAYVPTSPVVTMTGSNLVRPRVVLKGFTITGGGSTYGGGIKCQDVVAVLEKNHVHDCAATYGGGISFLHCNNESDETLFVRGCHIDNNAANWYGGGIYFNRTISGALTQIFLQGNEIYENTAVQRGGGVYMRKPYMGYEEDDSGDTILNDNAVHGNVLTGVLSAVGGGIYSENMPHAWVIRNQITDNQPDGICMHGDDFGYPLSLGSNESPAFNVLMRNGSANGGWCDYRLVGNFLNVPPLVVGNYWGTLDGATIRSHIQLASFANCFLNPIAASGKWFTVNSASRCTTNVLVTGDLRVEPGVELWIKPSDTFRFATLPDTSLPGGDPDKTDFILAGQGSSLQATDAPGLVTGNTCFTSLPSVVSPVADEWYGIRLKSGSDATLRYCDVDSAYCGVEVDSAFAEIESSKVYDCQLAGVHSLVGGRVNVIGSEVKNNGVYGVRCEFPGLQEPQEPCRVESNQLSGNGYAGVSFKNVAPTEGAPPGALQKVLHNHVVAGNAAPFPPPYGIEIRMAGDSIRVDSNRVSGFHQAGIVLRASRPSIVGNTVYGDTVNGIACFDLSYPHVRWNTVDSNSNGVFCDGTSLPNLGTEADPGNNSILFDNDVWVRQDTITPLPVVMAQYNWWGDTNPSQHPGKFIGNIVYEPWLYGPPGGDDGGQQSAGPAPSLLETGLGRSLPMPMRGTARIPFQVAHAGPVSLNVVDASGRVVRALVRGERAPGRYNVTWDRSDNSGRRMPEGVYFLRFEAGARRDVQKLVVMH